MHICNFSIFSKKSKKSYDAEGNICPSWGRVPLPPLNTAIVQRAPDPPTHTIEEQQADLKAAEEAAKEERMTREWWITGGWKTLLQKSSEQT